MNVKRHVVSRWVLLGACALASSAAFALDDQIVENVTELTNAIVRANAGTHSATIVLKPGTYDLSGLSSNIYIVGSSNKKCGTACAFDNYGPASLVSTVALNLRGENATHWSQKTREQESILKGSGAMRIIYGYSGTGRKSTYQHLTFEGGAAGKQNGGAIYAAGSSYTLVHGCSNCVFRGCTAGQGGATANVSATDCLYEENSVTGQGGAAYGNISTDTSGPATNQFIACVFRRNYSASSGGALYCNTALDTLRDCVFEANTSKGNYASLYTTNYTLITGCTFKDNVSVSGKYAGVAVTNLTDAGTIENCVFDNNTAKSANNQGSQIHYAKQVTGCTFSGYGDMMAVAYDRCTFGGCTFDYYKSGGGMIVFDSTTGGGHLRNCLFTNNTVTVIVDNESAAQVEVANCTFVGNDMTKVDDKGGFMFYAFRGGTDPNDATKALPSTNYIVNCVFKNNTRAGVRSDVSSYRTTTKVSTPALCILQNSIYEEIDDSCNDKLKKIDCIKADPKLVADSPRYAEAPACMISRVSRGRRSGLLMDWMSVPGESDIQGTWMVSADDKVDMGCYQCNLKPIGFGLFFR